MTKPSTFETLRTAIVMQTMKSQAAEFCAVDVAFQRGRITEPERRLLSCLVQQYTR